MKRLILLFLSISTIAQAQKLTLEECREMAVDNNRTLRIAVEQTLAARDQTKAYKANYLPKFSATGNYLYTNSSMTLTIPGGYLPTFVPNPTTGALDPNILMTAPDGTPVFKEYAYMPETNLKLKTGSVYTAGLLAEQPIYLGGKVRSAAKMATIGEKIASLNQKKAESDVIAATDEAFFTCIKAEELLKTAQMYNEVVAEFLRQMENATEIGMKDRNDLLKVQVRMNEARLQLRQAENGVRLARMNLCYWIGLPLTTESIELADFDDISLPVDRSLDVTERPEYGMLQEQVALKQQNMRLTRSEFLPQIAAIATYSYMHGLSFNGSRLFDDASFAGGVTMSIPLFHWGEGRRKVSAAKREINIAQTQLEDLTQKMELELTQSLNNYDEALLEVALMEESVAQAEENMTVSRNQYEVGTETLGDYLEAQTLWQKTRCDWIDARAKARLAYTNYLKATGKL